jgi:hypothetical protein
MAKQPGLFSPKFGKTSSHVFTQSLQNFALEPGIHSLACWHKFFVLPQLLYRWRHRSGIFCIQPRIILGYMKTGISGFKPPFVSLIPISVFLWFVVFERQHRYCETGGCLTTIQTICTKVLTFSQVNFNLTLAILLYFMFYNEKLSIKPFIQISPSLHSVPYMRQYTYFHIFINGMVLPLYCWGVTDMIHCNGRHWEVVNKHVVSYVLHIHIM